MLWKSFMKLERGCLNMRDNRGIRYFPIALFSSVMGLSAVTIAIKNIEILYGKSHFISSIFLIISSLLFILNVAVLLYRFIYDHDELKKDFNHPVKMNFFAAISISLLLLAVLYIDIYENLSLIIWVIGAVIQLGLTLIILTRLMWNSTVQQAHFTPVSFIPIVGNLVVSLAGSQHVGIEINWFFYSIGIFFSIIFMTIFMYRIFFYPPLPQKIIPTLFILLAPPSIGFISILNIVGEMNSFVYILYGVACFIALLLIFQIQKIIRLPFFISWWSLLFPSAAFTIATIRLYMEVGQSYVQWIIYVQMVGLLVLVIYLTWQTLQLVRQRSLGNQEK